MNSRKSSAMNRRTSSRRQLLLQTLLGAAVSREAVAAPAEIVVAQVAPFSGGLALYARELALGAAAMFAAANASGGIRGAVIRFIQQDDREDARRALALYEDIARQHQPVAFMYPVGPEAVSRLLQGGVPQRLAIPVIGTVPAMHKLRKPVNPYVFHIGVGDDAELAKIVEHIATQGMRSLGVVHWDEPSAHEAAAFIEAQARSRGVRLSLKAPVPAGTDEVGAAVAQCLQAAPAALIAILPVHATSALVRQLRGRNNLTSVYGPSYTESATLAALAGSAAARGVGVSQVVPNPFSGQTALVRDYQAALRRHAPPGTRPGTLSLEGYIAAKLIVLGLQQVAGAHGATTPLTGQALRQALEAMSSVDLGGLWASLGPQQHVALRFLDIGVVSEGGRLVY